MLCWSSLRCYHAKPPKDDRNEKQALGGVIVKIDVHRLWPTTRPALGPPEKGTGSGHCVRVALLHLRDLLSSSRQRSPTLSLSR